MRVIATIWKQPYKEELNQRMIEAGVDAFRVKCSHHSAPEISEALVLTRAQIDRNGGALQLLADLPEAKIRLGAFPQETIEVSEGSTWTFKVGESSADPTNFIPVGTSFIGKTTQVGECFYIGDGELAFEILSIEGSDTLNARAKNSGILRLRRSVSLPSTMDELDHITPFLDDIIPLLPKSRPDFVAFSFVHSARMLKKLQEKLAPHTSSDWHPKVIAKIESQQGVDNIEDILAHCDGIMIARGDLALTTPYGRLGLLQKKLTRIARRKKKIIMVATGALTSTLSTNIPARSDILDVTNACLDGADALVLSTETAGSEAPDVAIRAAKHIINETLTYERT